MRTAAVSYLVRPMALADIRQVMEVERESFPNTWPQTAFKRELQQNRLARYLVVVELRYPVAGEEPSGTPLVRVPLWDPVAPLGSIPDAVATLPETPRAPPSASSAPEPSK